MNTLYLRMPSRAAADAAADWLTLACPYALADQSGKLEREGVAALAQIAPLVPGAQRVVLLLAASDVTLLRVKTPPLSPARLKSALPGLVEERLIGDPYECALVPGPATEGMRTVAVVQRDWLDRMLATLRGFGARQLAALPSQLCLPWEQGRITAAVTHEAGDTALSLRLGEHEGIGLPILVSQDEAADVLQTVDMMRAEAPVTIYLPQEKAAAFSNALAAMSVVHGDIELHADSWAGWIAGARAATLDLAPAGTGATSSGPDLRAWRLPIALAAGLLLFNILALNIDWLRMKREAGALRASMTSIYRAAFPRDTVVVKPLEQMQQKLAALQRGTGSVAPDDFGAMLAAVGEAWGAAGVTQPNALAALEYRERSLLLRFKPGISAPTDKMKQALSRRNLALTSSTQSSATVWQIRSAK